VYRSASRSIGTIHLRSMSFFLRRTKHDPLCNVPTSRASLSKNESFAACTSLDTSPRPH
jgi:hypothetical protein